MKKISCLIVLLLVLGLCACGNNKDFITPVDSTMNSAMNSYPQIEETTPNIEAETNNKGENNDYTDEFLSIVKVRINPEMDIYLDSLKNIISVEYINDDARKLASLSLIVEKC